MTNAACRCGATAEVWTCCGHPTDGSSGGVCDHDGGTRVCGACWDELEAAGEVSSSSTKEEE